MEALWHVRLLCPRCHRPRPRAPERRYELAPVDPTAEHQVFLPVAPILAWTEVLSLGECLPILDAKAAFGH